jgi:2-polyprenyl-3-methyl-5-hydroxy-6-metoxy-1,4-benzoquinol methylase
VQVASQRLGLVGALLADALQDRPGVQAVLDCGGGSGTFAVPLAAGGARVTVVDISADALATLRRRADEAGVADRVVPVPGDVEALDALGASVPASSFDLVLAHGILDAVDDVDGAFGKIAATVRPGGLLSVLVGNPVAAVLARALAGDLDGARHELDQLDRASGPARVRALCERNELHVEQVHGIGVFTDLVPGAALDAPGARSALADLEAVCATRSPFADIAARVHVLARRPER